METISTTVMFKGFPMKIENGKIFLRSFGTTYYNKSMHWSWLEVSKDKLKEEIRKELIEKGLI